MNTNNTIPFIKQSSLDGADDNVLVQKNFLKDYVDLVNRIITRHLLDNNDNSNFDELSLSKVC